jgi:OmpA-OmpF porin, OOP family
MRSRTGAAVLLATAAVLLLWRTPLSGIAQIPRGGSDTAAPAPARPNDVPPGSGGAQGQTEPSPSASPAPSAASDSTTPITTVLVLGSVFFPSNQRVLGPDASRMLEGIAATYKGTSQQLEIVGHADARGSAAANLTLSASRAEAVRAFLASQGIPAGSMRVLFDGARTPMARGVDPEANAQNRRVEIRVPRPAPAAR